MGRRCGEHGPQAVDQTRGDVTTFFTDAAALVFGIDFAHIDLIDMVARQETVQALRDAQTHADIGDYVTATAGLAIAFNDMLDHYSRHQHFGVGDLFGFGSTLHELNPGFARPERIALRQGRLGDVVQHVQALTNVAAPLQRAMRMIALGIDYRRYVEFDVLTPRVNGYFDRSTRYVVTKAHENLTEQDYQTCKRFVIESALQAAKADAALNARTRHLQVNRPEPGVAWTPSERTWTGPAASTSGSSGS